MKITETVALNAGAARRRRRRILAGMFGLFAVVVIAAAFPMQVFLAIALPLMAPPLTFELGGVSVSSVLTGSLSVGAAVIGTYMLLMFLAPQKSVVLYLRRFRLTAVAQAMTDAIESGVGRHYRILTLDDANFVPLEVPPLERWISRYGSLVPILGAVALFLIVMWTAAILFGRYGYSFNGVGIESLLIAAGFLVFVVPEIGPVIEYWVLFLVPAFLLHRWRVKKRSRVQIATIEDLSACLEYCRALSGKLRAPAFTMPQATVVKVVDGLWQQAVTGMAERAEVVVIDVSAPTVHVLWEIETANESFRSKIVYIGQKSLMKQWMSVPTCGDDREVRLRIHVLLEGATVIAYEQASRASRRRFGKNLRNALDNLCGPSRTRFDIPVHCKGIMASRQTLLPTLRTVILLYIGLAVLCLPLNWVIWRIVWKYLLAGLKNA